MSIVHLGVVAAFVAGLLSFLSPCVFPLVPGYLSYIAGATVSEARYASGARWSPCIGPVLGSIFALAATSATLAQGVFLLLVYALGLGTPFLLVGLLIDRAGAVVRRVSRYVGPISVAGGVVLALTGVLILSGRLAQLATYAPLIS